jgi:PAS domain S-box-containing protein
MSGGRSSSWFYPKPTGDPGRDRNARTLQFACFLLAFAVGLLVVLNTIERDSQETPMLLFAVAGLFAASAINRAGRSVWAARTAFLSLLLTATLLVFEARDGFRSLAMLMFPALLLISVMVLDRASYIATAAMVLVAVAALGIAERHGLTHAIPHVRTSTNYGSIFFVDLGLLIFALIVNRIARDTQRNVTDLNSIINQLTAANILLTKSAEALRQSEGKYRRLHESITDAVVAVDMAGHILETNPTFQSMLGYTEEELRRLTYQELTPERWHTFEARVIGEQVMARGHSEVYEKEYRRRDGTVFPVEVRRYLLRNESDQPIGMWAIARDISKRKHDERAIREGEQRLRIAKDAAKLGIYEYDIACGTILWDTRVRQFWGVGPDVPITIDTFFSGLHAEDRARTQALLDRALDPAGNGEYYAEYRVISQADGNERWVAATGQVFFESGRPVHMIGTGQDITERKQAEAAVRESEERFRNMADTAPVMIWVSGLDKRCTFFNKPWLDFRGRTLEQERGKGWVEGVHPEDLDRCSAIYSAAFDSRRPFQKECRLRRADGVYRWVLDNGTPLYREGEFIGFIGSCLDITEQKQMEEQLRANEARLMDAQRLAKVGSWELDPETGRLDWSDEMFRIFGVPNDAQPDYDLFLGHVHLKDREMIVESRHTAIASATPIKLEFRIVRPDGNVRFIRSVVQTIKNGPGAPLRFVGATQDITEQISASQSLRESEERLRNAERIAHVGNWAWDPKTNHVSWSEELFRIHGQPADLKLNYQGIRESVAPQDRDRVTQWVGNCLAQKRGSSIEYRIARPNGDLRTVSCTAEVLLDEEGMPVRLIGTCQDVTDVRREQQESFARQKLESVGTLAGGIAHDFNNLLGGILGQAELALSELEAGSAPEEELKAIREVALRGSEIVRQLMIYAGKESDTVGPVDLSRTVGEMVELLKVSVSKHAVLVTNLGRDLPAVQANAAQIRRIVMNLVTNASQAIGNREGVIRVSTARVAASQSAAPVNRGTEQDYVELEVSDNGCGMPQEMQSKVFDPFFTTRSAGHGLGLAVVQGIVRNLGGTIHLASEPGKGTTFRILMPCAPVAAEETAGVQSGAGEPARELLEATVLIVEDEDVLRWAVARVLRGKGAEVLEAANGSAAIDLLRTKGGEIDLILLDMTIPGPSSQQVLAEAAQGRPDLKVILTSAYSEEMVAASVGSPVVRTFIRKPFSLRDLVQTLRSVLST